MKKNILILLFILIPVVSGAKNFNGPFLDAGVGGSRTDVDVNFQNWFEINMDETRFNGKISAGFAQRYTTFCLSGRIYYIAGEQDAGTTIQQYRETAEFDTLSFKLRNTWGFDFEPGIIFNNSTLAYLKIGYSRSSGEWAFNRPIYQDRFTGDISFHGYSFGIGVKRKVLPEFTANLYVFAEVQKIYFREETVTIAVSSSLYKNKYKPSTLQGFVGIGYEF